MSTLRVGMVVGFALATSVATGACTAILGPFDYAETGPGTGGDAGGEASVCTTMCNADSDCNLPLTGVCATNRCESGCCAVVPLAAMTPAPGQQTTGDCLSVVCDGTVSGTTKVADSTDTPPPMDSCHKGTCNGPTPGQAPSSGTCAGGKVCGDPAGASAGMCVGCNVPTDCMAPSTMCVLATCASNTCGTMDAAVGATCSDNGGTVCDGAGNCVVPCPGGQIKCGGTCVDTQTDNGNCGGCGFTCSTGCAAGECVVTQGNVPNANTIVINAINAYVTSYSSTGAIYSLPLSGNSGSINLTPANSEPYPTGIAIDGTYVYWTTDGSTGNVKRMSLGGGTTTTLATGQAYPSLINPSLMAIDATNLYWTNYTDSGTVMMMNLSSLAVSTLITGLSDPQGIAVDSTGTYAYVANTGAANLVKVQISSKSIVSNLTSSLPVFNPYAVALDSTNVYFTDSGNNGDAHQEAQSASTSDGISLGTSTNPGGIATDGVNVYYIGNTSLYKCPVGVANGCKVLAAADSGGFVAVDAKSVYWTNATSGTVKKITPK